MPSQDGKTALHFASAFGNTEMANALLAASGIDVNIKDNVGEGGIPTAGS